jgi:hypothetical protein
MQQLMQEQPKVPPRRLDQQSLLILAGQIKQAIGELAQLGIPDALGHLDLSPGNILNSQDGCVFLDWADAYIGPPFLAFEYLRSYARRRSDCADLSGSTLREAYLEEWTHLLGSQTFARATELTPLVAVFAYAAGTELWRDPTRVLQSHVAGYLRSLTRRMETEAKLLVEKAPSTFRAYATQET